MQLDPGAHSRDLRVRTLSCILAALECTEPVIPLPTAANSELQSPYSSSRKGRSRLELLNQVALLLVRERRIVGVLPKRSGPRALVELLVATDSGSDSPKLDATEYIIVRNPRRNPPTDSAISHDSTVILQHLNGVATGQQLLAHLNTYKSVPLSCHIASIELLLNKIISSHRQRLAPRKLFRKLFSRYITFRSVPKMRRRFESPAFQSYLTAICSATKTQISAEVADHYQRRSSNTYPTAIFASTECIFIGQILFFEFFDRSTCPYLVGQLQAGLLVEYNPETAFEFHQILLFAQKMAMDSVTHLSRACKSTDTNCVEATLANTEIWMKKLYQLVQCSPIFEAHMDIIEAFVSPQRLSLEPAPMAEVTFQDDNDGPSDATIEISQAQGDDADNGPSDATIEISQAQATHRVAHQSLWLAVSYQQAIESVTNSGTLPAEPLKLTLWEPPTEIVQRTAEMEPWQDIIKNMYPDNADEAGNFTSKEVIDTLQAYARQHGKSKFFLRDDPQFGGCYHAEAMLGTLAYLGHHYHPTTTATETPTTETPATETPVPGQELTLFQHTYRHIGVSKRCCPICTKLLSLLSTSYNSGQPLLRVLSGHQNIYPTALPPFVPEAVAEALIKWLEELVRTAVARLVKKRRRESDASSVSSKSDDSKIDRPGQGGEEWEEEWEEEGEGDLRVVEGGRGTFVLWR
ncbi:hypothetical protein L211DRAFT_866091 [Terfezia boudieri ATCC MYA-4762]|uniref:Uncharacterized protein n=1 Tax=Terfezia boudieri ATCC MYA-4762 TaxID=1051890 RepID=A0A3N4LWE1_9PEZI|nr:hypothetical protein L211DRAFT_866091 [Terfezia boudieri ATCC MYA-4762]